MAVAVERSWWPQTPSNQVNASFPSPFPRLMLCLFFAGGGIVVFNSTRGLFCDHIYMNVLQVLMLIDGNKFIKLT